MRNREETWGRDPLFENKELMMCIPVKWSQIPRLIRVTRDEVDYKKNWFWWALSNLPCLSETLNQMRCCFCGRSPNYRACLVLGFVFFFFLAWLFWGRCTFWGLLKRKKKTWFLNWTGSRLQQGQVSKQQLKFSWFSVSKATAKANSLVVIAPNIPEIHHHPDHDTEDEQVNE